MNQAICDQFSDDQISNECSARRDLLACLGQAMLAPRDETFVNALREVLPEELAELSQELGLDYAALLASLREALAQVQDAPSLLIAYSHLFLNPPIQARLNLALLVDDNANDTGLRYLDEMLARYGLALHPEHKDLPDHITTVLELTGWLLDLGSQGNDQAELEGATLARSLIAPAARHLAATVAAIEQTDALPPVYSRLLGLIAAVCQDQSDLLFGAEVVTAAKPAYFAKRHTAPDLIHCTQCQVPMVTERELKVVMDRLHQAGLPSRHLRLCPQCRDASRNWKSGGA